MRTTEYPATVEHGCGGKSEQRRLLAAVGAGDADALARFYDLTSSRVHALALAVSSDAAIAAELTRITYLEVWRTASDYDPDAMSPLAWLLALTHALGRASCAAA